ncbi:hypothetical protein MFLAVUS_009673 [Mucor flavus]|uniref:Uncharacterized protein n=1 Tax=Mucor flavus TaxID=439312 RepID=A0ABP9ZAM5_9FUNG
MKSWTLQITQTLLLLKQSVFISLSPRNPPLFKSPERTAAVQTAILFLNSVNDRIVFNWIEIETLISWQTCLYISKQSTMWTIFTRKESLIKDIVAFC